MFDLIEGRRKIKAIAFVKFLHNFLANMEQIDDIFFIWALLCYVINKQEKPCYKITYEMQIILPDDAEN